MIGDLESEMDISTFVKHVKANLAMPSVRYVGNLDQIIKKVAIIGGSVLDLRLKPLNKVQISLSLVILNIMMH